MRFLAAILLLASIDENSWVPPDITPGHTPVRYLVMSNGWRISPRALVVNDPARVRHLYRALAGNQRLGYTCGYHWTILFEYRDARPESIDINESYETFRRAPKETWAVVARAFTAAAKHPSHSIAHVRPAHAGDTRCLAPYQPFDTGDGGWFIVTSKRAFGPARVDALKKACGKGTTVTIPETMDTGN